MNRVIGLSAAEIAKSVMLWLHPDESREINEAPFPEPRGYKPMRICPVSGLRALPICPDVMLEYFKPEAEPAASCNVHMKFAVDRRTGEDAAAMTPNQFIDYKTRTALPPEYAGWGSRMDFLRPAAQPSAIPNARIRIQNPVDGGRFLLDPDTPLQFQVLTLRAAVTPAVPEIVWYVDGKTMTTAAYPYEAHLPLEPGTHDIQARFPHAAVASNVVTITVSK
jgi:penicillin-binding protein 1C